MLTWTDRAPLIDERAHPDIGTITDQQTLLERFMRDLAQKVPLLDLSHDGWPRVAVLHEHLYLLSTFLRDGARLAGYEITLRNRDGWLKLKNATLIGIDDFICARPTYELSVAIGKNSVRTKIQCQTWVREEGQFVGPENHPVARRFGVDVAERHGFFQVGSVRHVSELLASPLSTEVAFPVDVVFTWVNHRDPGWRALWAKAVGTPLEEHDDDTRGIDRFMNRDELKYSMRSIHHFAPWVRNIHVVTNCSAPDWLDLQHPQIRWVDHREVIPEDVLPVFSSHAIESRLQHVPGLADHFLYFNDDFFLTRPTSGADFFESSGLSKSFMERYGSVNGDPHPDGPDYLNAARNGRRLLEQAFQRSVTALHMHTPYALRREVLLEMEERFGGPIRQTTARRFRTMDDISTVSFLYHHYAYLTGKAIYARSDAALVKPQAARYERRLQQILDGVRVPISLCLNDGGGSNLYPHWDRHVVEFLEAFFPTKSPFER